MPEDNEDSSVDEQNDNEVTENQDTAVENETPKEEPNPFEPQPDTTLPADETEEAEKPVKPKRSKKKLLIITAVVLILIAGAGAAYYFFFMDSSDDSATQTTSETEDTSPIPPAEPTLNTVAYAYKENDAAPYELFWRPADGGDKTTVEGLPTIDQIGLSDIHANKVAVQVSPVSNASGDSQIWYSADGGNTYEKIFTTPESADATKSYQITSIKLSADGSQLLFGLLPPGGTNQVTSINLETKETASIFSSEENGVFIYGYNSDSGEILYTEGCYQCDGNVGNAIMKYDTNDKASTEVIASTETSSIAFSAMDNDFTKFLTTGTTVDTSINNLQTIDGKYIGPPFILEEINLSDNQGKELGEFGEKLSVDTFSSVSNHAGYMNDGVTPYFAIANQIYQIGDTENTLLFESDKEILGVYYVDFENVVVSTGTSQDFTLYNFSIADNKPTEILSGNPNAIIFGATIN